MSNILSQRATKWGIGLLVVVVVAFVGFKYWAAKRDALPEGIASGNGRISTKLVDVAAKSPLRVKEILVDEGDMVKPDQVLVQLDTSTLEAQLAEAQASIAAAQQQLTVSHAAITKQESAVGLAKIEVGRSENLVKEGAGSQRELDVRRTHLETTGASLAEAEATQATAEQQVKVAEANAATIQTQIDDATLKSPVTGRVLYRLAEPGEVLAAGGKALTLVDLRDVYMEIFLPANEAARLKVGSEARIVLDVATNFAIPAKVSFVSPEAQFTPKQVETQSEREKLMFRVKVQVPPALAEKYLDYIKTGVRGVAYVKLVPSAVWPERLQHLPPGAETDR